MTFHCLSNSRKSDNDRSRCRDEAIEYAPVSHIRLNQTEHLLRCLCHLHEHAVVDLQETEKLKNFAWLRRDLVDTTNADDEVHFRLGGDVEVVRGARSALEAHLFALLRGVLLYIGLGALEDDFALGALGL